MRCQHIALMTIRLDATYTFYVDLLGMQPVNYDPAHGLLALSLDEGFVLRFEAGPAVASASIRFIGIELDSFDAVDRLHARLAPQVEIITDLRPQFTATPGPYGFIIADPNGYRIKLFRYGPRIGSRSEG
jgi:catechol 2,3-dioxygenase-like lactoylglutathione lyase family enzyme